MDGREEAGCRKEKKEMDEFQRGGSVNRKKMGEKRVEGREGERQGMRLKEEMNGEGRLTEKEDRKRLFVER